MPSVPFAFAIAIGAYVCWLVPERFEWPVWLAAFTAAFLLHAASHYASQARGVGIARRIIGLSAGAGLALLVFFTAIHAAYELPAHRQAGSEQGALYVALMALALYFVFRRRIREFLGRLAAPIISVIRQSKLGMGGSAAFGGGWNSGSATAGTAPGGGGGGGSKAYTTGAAGGKGRCVVTVY